MDPRHEREIARFGEMFGAAYSAWLDAQPRTPRVAWAAPVSNDNTILTVTEPVNDNHREAA